MKLVYYKYPESDSSEIKEILSFDKISLDIRVFDEQNELDYIKEKLPDRIIFEEKAVPFAFDIFLEMISEEIPSYNPDIFVYHTDSGIITSKDLFLKKPYSSENAVKAILSEYECIDKYEKINMSSLISGILSELKIPVHMSGYRYLREAILISVYNPHTLENITKTIYPIIENRFKLPRGSSERSMRHAIETVWDRSDSVYFRLYFKRKKKPSNSLFISTISKNIRFYYREEIENEIRITESCRKYLKKKKVK